MTDAPPRAAPTVRRLLGLMGPFRGWMALGVGLSAATTVASVGLMAVSAFLISKAALVHAVADVAVAVTAVRFFALARASLRYAERYITHKATFRILTGLRVWLYRAVEPLAPAGLEGYRGGDLLTRLVADVETLEGFYLRVVIPPLAAAVVALVAAAILALLDPLLGLVLLAFLALTGLGLPLATRRASRAAAAEAIAARAELNAALVDQVQGLAELVAFGQEAAQAARIAVLDARLHRAQERLARLRGLGLAAAALLTGLAGLTVLAMAVPLVTSGQMDGVYLALVTLTAIASFEAIQPLVPFLPAFEASRAAAQRIFELVDAAPAVPDPKEPLPLAWPPPKVASAAGAGSTSAVDDAPTAPGLEVSDLWFRYGPAEPWVLDGLSFAIPPGGRLALVGPSGAGKSSLVSLLARFWDYEAGSIRLAGRELSAGRADEVRALLAIVPQRVHLFNATVRDNLYVAAPEATDAELEAACRLAELHEVILALPAGYDTLVGENGVRLSGGERQRLALARAILTDRPVVVLDEPTAHLDALTEASVWAALDGWLAGRTVLVITHGRAGLARVDAVLRIGPPEARSDGLANDPVAPDAVSAPQSR